MRDVKIIDELIVSMTSYPVRINNVPVVLDSILQQSLLPSKIVINLSIEEFPNKKLPSSIGSYVQSNNIEIIWNDGNTKVWKKLIPTLNKYPNSWVLSIDDDFVYPEHMIEDFWDTHTKHPNSPISGNNYYRDGIKYHCGCASLTTKKFFGSYIDNINESIINNCPSDDVFYTFICERNGYHYVQTKHCYNQSKPYNQINAYSVKYMVRDSINYLNNHYHYATIIRKNENSGMPLCVYGMPTTKRGEEIFREFEKLLLRNFEVHIVKHDGLLFEQPALQYMQDVCSSTGRPCLYLHSKGSFNDNDKQSLVRRMWIDELILKKEVYFNAVNSNGAVVSTPFSSPDGVTWYNGFVANQCAMKSIGQILPNKNRYIYECIFRNTPVSVVGLIRNDIENMPYKNNRKEMYKYLMDNYG